MNEVRRKRAKKIQGGDPRSLERNRESNQKGPYSFESSKTKQANVLSCFTSAEEKGQNLRMNAYEEYEKVAVVIDSGASNTVASARSSSRVQSRRQQHHAHCT